MRFFSSELGHHYGSYTFGYCNYCEVDASDSLSDLYTQGYLPYSGSPTKTPVLYMARSARVVLTEFELSSENRRIAKKFDGQFTKERIPVAEFNADEDFYTFCLTYFATRHGDKTMPRARLEFIMASPCVTHVVRYMSGSTLVGYVFALRDGPAEHYWFSFYDLTLAKQSLGLWLMLDCIRDAKTAGLSYYYVGTVYGEKALYKTNFAPLEWWTGAEWSRDITKLKERGRSDTERVVPLTDLWKQGQTLF